MRVLAEWTPRQSVSCGRVYAAGADGDGRRAVGFARGAHGWSEKVVGLPMLVCLMRPVCPPVGRRALADSLCEMWNIRAGIARGAPAQPGQAVRPAAGRTGPELCYNSLRHALPHVERPGPRERDSRMAARVTASDADTTMNDFTLTQTAAEPQTLAFTDADSCAQWFRTLSLTNIPRLYTTVLGQLKRLTESDFPPRERAKIAEVLREPVGFLHTELARRYAGKPQPANEREVEAAEQALVLWQALWEQYSACLKPLLEGDPDLQGVKAKVLQRGLYVGKQIVLVYGLARRLPAPRRMAGAACLLPTRRDARMRRYGGHRRVDAERDRRIVLFDVFARPAA